MVELLSTTIHSIMRQTRINTQNMIVLTVEFTRIPLFTAGEIQHRTSVIRLHHLRRLKHGQSRRTVHSALPADTNPLPPG